MKVSIELLKILTDDYGTHFTSCLTKDIVKIEIEGSAELVKEIETILKDKFVIQ